MRQVEIIVATLLPERGETGVQTHFSAIAAIAAENGIDVMIVTPEKAPLGLRVLRRIGQELRRYSPELGVTVARLANYHSLIYRLRRLAPAKGRYRVAYAQDPMSAKALIRDRHRLGIDRVVSVVHYNLSEASELINAGLAKPEGALHRGLMQTERTWLPKADSVLFPSHFMQEQVLGRVPEVSRRSHSVIPNFAIPHGAPGASVLSGDLISIGTLEDRKNQRFLIDVLSLAHQMGFRYSLTLVGQGPDRLHLQDRVHQLGLDSYVTFAGFVPNAAGLIHTHRVYVHAARMENCPLVLVEALAAGRPILAAPVGGIPELFADGQHGRYWDLESPQAAAAALVDVLENPDTYQQMARAAVMHYGRFRPDHLAPKWLKAILGDSTGMRDVIG